MLLFKGKYGDMVKGRLNGCWLGKEIEVFYNFELVVVLFF